MDDVSHAEPRTDEGIVVLSVEERVWLHDRLHEYRALLAYLHDH